MNESVLKTVLDGCVLSLHGVHALRHWARVLENGRRIAVVNGADQQVVDLFAVFHDCRRVNEGTDPGHGLRSGELARTLHATAKLELSDDQFAQLHYACAHHTDGLVEADVTIQTCWDADRLDLGRVWVVPDPRYLCTSAAKDPSMIEWAEERSRRNHKPAVVSTWLSWATGVR